MKTIILAIILGFFAVNGVLACERAADRKRDKDEILTLCGKIREIVLWKHDDKVQTVRLTIDFEIKNDGSRPVILMPKKLDVLSGPARTAAGVFIASFSGYANLKGTFENYGEVRSLFDKEQPDPSNTAVIEPNKTLTFTREVSLDGSAVWGNVEKVWSEIKGNSSHELTLFLETADSRLYDAGKMFKAGHFWKGLRHRWEKYGILVFHKIQSELISLDFRAVSAKTEYLD